MARTNSRPSLGTYTHDTLDIRVRFAQQTDLDSLLELSLPPNIDSPIWNHIFPHLSRDRRIHPHYRTFKTLLRRHIKHSILDRSSFYLVAEKLSSASSSSSSPSNPSTSTSTSTLLAAVCFEWIMDDPLSCLRDRKLKVIFHTFLKRIVNAGEGKDHRYQFEPLRVPPVFGSYAEYVAYRQIRSESPCFDDSIAGFFKRHDVLDGEEADEGTREMLLRQLMAGIEGLQTSVLVSTGKYREQIGEGSGVWMNTPFSLCFCACAEACERQAALGEVLSWMSDVVSLGEGPGWGLGGPDGVCLLFPDSQPHGWYENGWTDRFLESHNYRWVRWPVMEPVIEMPGHVGREALEGYEMWFKEARSAPRRRG
ncbi:hypothetical protein QBC40DRAFT_297205 [Triangularia verruculosa]|uniref:Uncharacterized protein n=1 Tax=Triangularia verruculosa TaxID=2587418 RepID=A0AAN6XHU0_9PEZI|nr:hypothetical protein QBC40DRAFT_297205 [Triangularia verruculosa]